MKKSKIIALLLATVMVCMVVVGCANSKPKVKVNATFTVIINDEIVVPAHTAELEGTTESAPSVLEGICAILELYGIIPQYDEDSLVGANYNSKNYVDEGGNAWYYTINGNDGAKAGETILEEGDNIVYIYGPIA